LWEKWAKTTCISKTITASYRGAKFFYLVKFNSINCAPLWPLQLLIKPSDNYLLTERVRTLLEYLRPRPCHIDWVIAWSMQQGQGLRFSREDWPFEVNELFILWLFALILQTHIIIGLWALRENNTPELANQSMHYNGYKHYNDIITIKAYIN